MRLTKLDQARRHCMLANEALGRQDFAGAGFHIEMATRLARLEERVRRRTYDIEVVWRTDTQALAKRLVRVRSGSLETAHELAQAEIARLENVGERPMQSHLIGGGT